MFVKTAECAFCGRVYQLRSNGMCRWCFAEWEKMLANSSLRFRLTSGPFQLELPLS